MSYQLVSKTLFAAVDYCPVNLGYDELFLHTVFNFVKCSIICVTVRHYTQNPVHKPCSLSNFLLSPYT